MKLTRIAFLSVAALLLIQILLVEGNKERDGKKERDGGKKQRGGKPDGTGAEKKGSKSQGGKASLQGKFVSKEKADCVWSVTGTEVVLLNVQCTKEDRLLSCAFGGNPLSCPKYRENQKNYWKQITRALRKQKNICEDPKAVLKSKECKKGPPEAHLSYIISTLQAAEEKGNTREDPNPAGHSNGTEATKECADDVDLAEKRRVAEEYCGSSWSSLCNFFISMLQSKSC
ncbi:fibroblast growth factor-binding protein 1 [Pelobates fuscus]|uniref:fibroblast growth factor-binding protein 1 n=1 Tax=Pelobates fuscus TaxID=191477 RepID=UPI002FE4A03F